jgi:hypothetical protein
LSNLIYGTQVENADDKRDHGTLLEGEVNPSSLLSEDEVMEIYAQKGRKTQVDIAHEYGISRQAVSDIHRGITWGSVTGA